MRKTRKFAEGGDDFNTTDYASSGSVGRTNVGFKEAFRAARKQGLDKFTWKGKSFTTELEKPKASKAAEPAKKPEPAKAAEPAKKSEAPKKAEPMEEVTVKARRPGIPLPSDRATGYRSQVADTGMTPEERMDSMRNMALGAASMLPIGRAARAVGALKTTGKSLGERGFKMADKEKTAAQMEKFREQMSAKGKLSRGATYKSGGSVRGKGCEVKGTGKGRMC
jgi:hypothetical protein